MMQSARLGSLASPQELDRGNDGQDHTVLPYARPAISPQYSQPCRRSRKLTGETNLTAPLVCTKPRAHRDYPPCPHLSCRRCRVHRRPGSRCVTTQDRPSWMSRDERHIRQTRISVKWNILREWIDRGRHRRGRVARMSGATSGTVQDAGRAAPGIAALTRATTATRQDPVG